MFKHFVDHIKDNVSSTNYLPSTTPIRTVTQTTTMSDPVNVHCDNITL